MIRPPSTGLLAKAGVGKAAAAAAPKSEPAPPVVAPETSASESADAPPAPDSEEPPSSDEDDDAGDDAPGIDIASPEVRAAITAVTVEVTAPIINEDGVTYRVGERFQTSPERAAALAHLTAVVS